MSKPWCLPSLQNANMAVDVDYVDVSATSSISAMQG